MKDLEQKDEKIRELQSKRQTQIGVAKEQQFREDHKNRQQKKEEDQIERLKQENQKSQHKIKDLKKKLKDTKTPSYFRNILKDLVFNCLKMRI